LQFTICFPIVLHLEGRNFKKLLKVVDVLGNIL
jgi:hypothetical protein